MKGVAAASLADENSTMTSLSSLARTRRLATVVMVPLVISLVASVSAQRGDRDGHVMTPPPDHWEIPQAPVLSPEKEEQTFSLEDGFRVNLFAAEPLVHDPVAIVFDGNGRLWVAEMRGYMPDIDGKTEKETPGRISVLDDTDNDGTADRHTVFLEDVLLPRALAFTDADRSLLFADNESLYEIEIIEGEKGPQPGERTVVDEKYAAGGNPEHKANGLLYGLDNWFYSSKHDVRYRKVDGEWTREKTESRGQWGIAQDDLGRILTNTNSNLVTLEEIAPGLTVRHPHHPFSSKVTKRMNDQRLRPARITPGVNRGYMEGVLDKDGYLTKPTAASGLVLYRGHHFPERYAGQLFVPEPAGNLVTRAAIREGEDGSREIVRVNQEGEWFTSTDERSRIVNIYNAPDGSLYLLDFYRGIIQHAVYMTSYLRAQVEERKLYEPAGLGRIWRVTHEDGDPHGPAPSMAEESTTELVAHLSHPNGWWRETAQRLLVQRGDPSAITPLRDLAQGGDSSLARIHALWALEGLPGGLDPVTIEAALLAEDPRVGAEAIRAAESLAGSPSARAIARVVTEKADLADLHTRRQVAASLGLFGEISAVVSLVDKHGDDDRLLLDLAMSGLAGREIATLSHDPASASFRASLVAATVRRGDPAEVEELIALLKRPSDFRVFAQAATEKRNRRLVESILEAAAEAPDAKVGEATLAGLIAATKKKGFRPIPTKNLPALLARTEPVPGLSRKDFERARKVFEVGSGREKSALLTDAHREQFRLGEVHYQRICLGCHQSHGQGQVALAPPLVASEWVTGTPERLIALIMDGIMGPIEVAGKVYQVPEIQPLMPGLRANPEFTDEQLAAIMTYVRNAWGNSAPPISTEAVTRYRESTEMRAPWPAAELRNKKW